MSKHWSVADMPPQRRSNSAAGVFVSGAMRYRNVVPKLEGSAAKESASSGRKPLGLGADPTPNSSLEKILRTAWAWQSGDCYAEAFRIESNRATTIAAVPR